MLQLVLEIQQQDAHLLLLRLKNMKIKYELAPGFTGERTCLTPCPNGFIWKGKKVMVHSQMCCCICNYYVRGSKKDQTIVCNYDLKRGE